MIQAPAIDAVQQRPSIRELLLASARRDEHAAALVAADGSVLTYRELLGQVDVMAANFVAAGVERGDRVALVLPNGIDAAVAFLAATRIGVACPLNPSARRSDFEFAFTDLGARLVVRNAECDSTAAPAAVAVGIPVIDIKTLTIGAPTNLVIDPVESDVALILHTSGTTARPKMVPLTHANVCSSAYNISSWLMLSSADRCLNVMPLFHIHGLVGALLATLAAGGSVVCSEGFVSPEFFSQLRRHRPTWYTAVPTMHQAILARAHAEPPPAPLRFVRSSSASLPERTARELEILFAAPVIEAYGMTEAAHQMCSNPLERGAQRYGSVGLSAGPDVSVLDAQGQPLPQGSIGEVAIRGTNVTAGYLGASAVNAAAFHGEWFRTGDLGRLTLPAISTSMAESKRSSTAVARKFRRARWTTCS